MNGFLAILGDALDFEEAREIEGFALKDLLTAVGAAGAGSAGQLPVSRGGADQQGTGPYVILQMCFSADSPFTWCGLWGAYADD